MTANRRILFNVLATYARSVYTLALGLLTSRWLLLSLGQTDYGLFGVIGGLVSFVTFVNVQLSGAVSRFYSVAIGFSQTAGNGERGLAECRRWFSTAVSIHSAVPLVLVAIGWPLGEWVVAHVLVVPPDRLAACLWVWRFACLSALVAMVNVPFRAMYVAKQEIAELTVFTVAEATLNVALLGYMVGHPADWLAKYAFAHCLFAIAPKVFICVRALVVYPECRIRRDCLGRWADIRELATFAGWNAFAAAGELVRSQGLQLLVNRLLGPVQNASMTLATRLANRANVFSASLVGSFSPAVNTAYGAENRSRMTALAVRAGKFAALLVVAISVPLFLEVDEVMRLWLKTPPAGAPLLCACVIAAILPEKLSVGAHLAIVATGRVAAYQCWVGAAHLLMLPVAAALMYGGRGLEAVGFVSLLFGVLYAGLRVFFARKSVGFSISAWLVGVVLPVLVSLAVAAAFGCLPRLWFGPSFGRVCLTTLCSEAALAPLAWAVVLDREERNAVRKALVRLWERGRKWYNRG